MRMRYFFRVCNSRHLFLMEAAAVTLILIIILYTHGKGSMAEHEKLAVGEIGNIQAVTKNMHKLVHLDLKGAPPKVAYLEKVIPLFHKWGATGLLVEYEDMFPYSGKLELLKSRNAYTDGEVKRILHLAAENHLEVIPLVQTFGHLEFVLKYEEYAHLRELAENPMDISPVKEGAYELVREMINQILHLHPDVNYIHIGCNEVHSLGQSETTKFLMKKEGLTREDLYLRWVKKTAKHVSRKHSGHVIPIIWDDMLRDMSVKVLQDAGIGKLVEPMVWSYEENMKNPLSNEMWQKYDHVFTHVWTASAYRGASNPNQFLTDIGKHRHNHLAWVRMMRDVSSLTNLSFKGIALTGWSRFDHFAMLCELLPVALPSLVACLQILQHGTWDTHTLTRASTQLKCHGDLEITNKPAHTPYNMCTFPGSELYDAMHTLRDLKYEVAMLGQNGNLNAWLTNYHLKQKSSNPYQLHKHVTANRAVSATHDRLTSLIKALPVIMKDIFYQSDIEEFMEEHILQFSQHFRKIMKAYQDLVKQTRWFKRP